MTRNWYVYLIRSATGAVYTGITLDVARRLREHGEGKGAKYLRGRGPLTVIYRRKVGDRSLALRVERGLKRLTKAEIVAYLDGGEGVGKAGGYGIQGHAGAFVMSIQGSYPAVVGLPLYETLNLLRGVGFASA